MKSDIMVTFIANAGVLIRNRETKVLIDGIHSEKVPAFSRVSKQVLDKMITGEGIFKDINYIMFTHAHKDHFNRQQTLNYIGSNRTRAIFTSQDSEFPIKKIEHKTRNEKLKIIKMSEVRGEKKEFVFNDITIKYFRITHQGSKFKEVENYGFIITLEDVTFLHLGDADFDEEVLEKVLAHEKIDYAFLNFPFVTLPKGRELINNLIKPQKILILHLPYQEDDLYNYGDRTFKIITRHKELLSKSKVLLEPLEEVRL